MKNKKKSQRKSFGRSFENAYQSTSNQKLFNELLHLELPKKSEKRKPKIVGVADPDIRKKMQKQLFHLQAQRFDSQEAAQQWADDDPYVKAGVYQQVMVKPFKKVFP